MNEDQALVKIAQLGRERFPHEAVGILVRDTVLELKNRSDTPHNHFKVYTEDIIEAVSSRGLEMTLHDWHEMVLWHTHPSGLIGPSREDMRNKVPELRRHLVVAINGDEATPSFY